MAVVKADAYGHGAVIAARALWRHGVRAFAVATMEEGIELRRARIRGTILVLGWTPAQFARRLARWHLSQTIADEAHARALPPRRASGWTSTSRSTPECTALASHGTIWTPKCAYSRCPACAFAARSPT